MLKIGLIGCGFMGGMHAACYKALGGEVKIVAVADVRLDKAEEAASKFGSEIFSTGMELIEKADVDVIDVCLPTYLHASHAIAAMEKGKNVFIEKPVCMNEQEAELLLEAEKKTGAKVQVGQVVRLWSEYAWLKETVEKKTFGNIVSAVFQRVSPVPTWGWENWLHRPECSGTMALDLHVHDADFIRYLMGEPKSLKSTAARDKQGVIQQIFTTYEYDNAVIFAEGCWDCPEHFPFYMGYRVKFEEATVVFSTAAERPIMVYKNNGEQFAPELDEEFQGDNDIGGNLSSLGAYYNELKYFTQGLINETPLTIAPLIEGVKSMKLVLKEIADCGGMVL